MSVYKKMKVATKRKQKSMWGLALLEMEVSVLEKVLSFFLKEENCDLATLRAVRLCCKKLRSVSDSNKIWNAVPLVLKSGKINLSCLTVLKQKCIGTEGICVEAVCKGTMTHFALKKTRPFHENEGVPYFMVREITTLKILRHPNVTPLLAAHLFKGSLCMLFPYVAYTLQDVLLRKPNGSPLSCPRPIKRGHAVALWTQLIDAISYCHSKGVIHRNLKPKHLLLSLRCGPGCQLQEGKEQQEQDYFDLEGAVLMLTDFALMRVVTRPLRLLTAEMMSLWYRPPEVLLGECAYTEAVDVWSAGCIFAEMLRGAVLFRGISQIEQLFQIFSKLGTPSEQTWPGISSMRFYREGVFPLWSAAAATASDGTPVGGEGSYSLAPLVRAATSRDLDLLGRCLRCCPENRCSAQQIKQILFEQPNIQEWCGASGSQQQMQISSRTWHSSSSELEQAIRISGVPLSQGRLREYLSSTTSSSCSCSSSSSSSDGGNRELVWSQLCHMQSTEDEDLQRPHKKAVRGCLVALKAKGPYIAAVEFICRIHHAKSAGKVGPQRSLHLAVSVLDQFLCAAAMAGCVGMTTPTMRWCSSFLGGSGSAFSSANYEVEKDPEAMSALLFELLVLSMACIQIASKYEDLTFLDAQEIIGLAQSLVIADEDTLLEVRSEREQNEFILQLLKPGGAGPIFGIAETKPPMKLTKVLEAEAEGACVCGKGEMDTCSDLESELQGEDGTQQTDVNRWDEPCKQPFYLMTRLEQVGAADVLVAEELVLRALDLRVRAAPAMIDFLGIYSTECFHLADVLNNSDIGSVKFHCPNFRLMPSSDDSIACDEADSSCSHFPHSFLASFLALAGEVSLSSGECAAIPPSLLAASLLTLSLYVHQEACWAIGRLLTNSSSGSEKSSQHSISPVQMVEVASEGYRLPWFDHILRCWAGFSLHQLRDCMLGLCAALRAHVAQQVYNLPARHISVSLAQNSHACFQITLRNLLGKVDWHRLEGWISALGPEKDVL